MKPEELHNNAAQILTANTREKNWQLNPRPVTIVLFEGIREEIESKHAEKCTRFVLFGHFIYGPAI